MQKLKAIWNLALTSGPESKVSKRWLLGKSGSSMDRKFASSGAYTIEKSGDYLRFQVADEVFLWPADLPAAPMIGILSELFTPTHPHQYQWGPTQVHPEDVVLDIGASEGAFSALVTGRCKQVIAVEPSRTMCALMRDLFRVRNQPCPQIVECLLGSRTATAYFAENPVNPGASRICTKPVDGAYQVPVLALDDLVQQTGIRPTYIKCDAEGAAFDILLGAREYLRTYRPKLAIASYHTDTEYADLFGLLKPMGYQILGKGFLFSHGKLRVQMLHAWHNAKESAGQTKGISAPA